MCRSKSDTANLRASLNELLQAGCPVDPSVAPEPAGPLAQEKLEIEQFGGPLETAIFELDNGRTGLRATIAITNHTARPIDLREVRVSTLGDPYGWDWLHPQSVPCRDKRFRKSSYQAYVFPGMNGLQLQPEEVLNNILFERRRVPAKRRLEGWLLGVGGIFPQNLPKGKLLKLSLVLVRRPHRIPDEAPVLRIQRLEARKQRTKVQEPRVGESATLDRNNSDTLPADTTPAQLPSDPKPRQRRSTLFD